MPESTKNEPVLKKDVESSPETEVPVEEEEYWEVYFLDRANDQDIPYHYLAVNGEALQIQKGTTVIVPERFLEVADHAIQTEYRRGKPVGEVSRCPYQRKRKATKAEYLQMRKKYNRQHKADLDQRSRAAERTTEEQG